MTTAQVRKRWYRLVWLAQAASGLGLVLLLGLHWVAQHYLASGSLRSYAEIIAWLRHPWLLSLEITFLVVVTSHALLGLRAILLDLGLQPPLVRWLNAALLVAGMATIGYGINLLIQLMR